jgi:N-acetylmuramoyl-L-alanine amidase CwlA
MKTIVKKISAYNHNKANRGKGAIKYIVLHWVGAVSSAKNNAAYFGGGNRGASAHYFIDASSIYQVVEDKNIAWHCGGKFQDQGSTLKAYGHKFYGMAKNTNSIGIEMCLDRSGHIAENTYSNTAELVESLMSKYDIPASRVIRHFDVTGKLCPGSLVKDAEWSAWKKKHIGAGADASAKDKPKPQGKPATTKRKSVDEIAREVLAGKWGNGDARRKKVTAAGYDYKAVQKRVNELLR